MVGKTKESIESEHYTVLQDKSSLFNYYYFSFVPVFVSALELEFRQIDV